MLTITLPENPGHDPANFRIGAHTWAWLDTDPTLRETEARFIETPTGGVKVLAIGWTYLGRNHADT